MADYSAKYASHNTLNGTTADKVTLTTNRSAYVAIHNYGVSGDIKATTDDSVPTNAQIVDCFVIKPGTYKIVHSGPGTDTIRLIAPSANAYSVEGAE